MPVVQKTVFKYKGSQRAKIRKLQKLLEEIASDFVRYGSRNDPAGNPYSISTATINATHLIPLGAFLTAQAAVKLPS